ncbi:MAG: hypothetical protein IJL14_00980 [Selenomonadaceae bacterium]|nr:hypothetical protein [Selenomonadaceae bacterium]MBR0289076.1 hypothetical protein [Selenomonadaceae bacterium]
MMLGKIDFEEFKGLTSMPQEYASAWSAIGGVIGAGYKPLLCVGKQLVRGMKYYFIAEQTLTDKDATRHIMLVAITAFGGTYTVTDIEPLIL